MTNNNIKFGILIFFLLSTVVFSQQKTLLITSPSENSSVRTNSEILVTWSSLNVKFIDISYSFSGINNWRTVAEGRPALPGNFSLTIPETKKQILYLKINDSNSPDLFDVIKINLQNKKIKQIGVIENVNYNNQASTVRIMQLGNSITEGVVGSTNDTGFRRTLDSLLNHYSYSFDFVGSQSTGIPNDFDKDHEGHGGWHADHPNYSSLSIVDSVYTWLVKNPADYVLLHIGTNDLGELEIFNQTSLQQVNDVSAILDSIDKYENDYAVDVPVFLARIINRTDNGATATVNETDTTTAFNLQLQQMAENRIAAGDKIILLNQEAALLYPSDLDDGIHPNNSGYKKMGYKWFQQLNSYFSGCPDNTISYWEMNESGIYFTVKDKLGMNDGSCVTGECPEPVNGMNFGALSFDGIDDKITVASHPTLNYSNALNFTVEVWVKTTQTGTGNKVIAGKYDGNPAWWLGFDASTGNAKFSFRSSTGDDYAEVTATTPINDGKWHFLAGVKSFDNSELKIYVDGNLENTITASYNGNFDGNNSLTIGNYAGNYFFGGRVDELRLYDRAINSDEIISHYNNGIIGESVCNENKFYVDAKIFLEGNYSSGTMSTTLNSKGLIPLEQPFSGARFDYQGAERVDAIPPDIVDWVLIELRSGTSGVSTAKMRAAFVKSNGKIVDLDGVSPVSISGLNEGNYYLTVHHRNHLSIMSANLNLFLNNSTLVYDFTTGSDKYYGGASATVQLENNIWGMISGDADGSNTVDAADRNATWNRRNSTGYLSEDVDLSGVVDAADRNYTWNNRNKSTAVP